MQTEKLTAYELIESRELKELDAMGYLLRHKKSNAHLFLVENNDDNKVFNIGFRTPPKDSTGVPHIIEHSVLCGSKKYPAKDPFVELVKGSLNTFLNAMTYPDKTMYPVASTNNQDFQNLMDVYMDSVLNPNISSNEMIFMQEGWHYELEDKDGPLTYNGVVYNEMKGAFSSPEEVLGRHIQQVLYPDTPYSNESGGDPDVIPELTYEAFLDFYHTYYHPSNSYIYLYGDMDMNEKLDWLDREYLSQYEAIEVDSAIPLQQPFMEMKDEQIEYGIAEGESEEDGTYLSWNKVVGTSLDEKLAVAFDMLEYVLLNTPGTPLRKALLDLNIGKDIYGGYDNGILQPNFSVIAKSAKLSQKEVFIETIERVLREVAEKGISKKSLQAGLNGIEFRLREADFGRYPKGLMFGLNSFNNWLHNKNEPFSAIQYEEVIQSLKAEIETDYFENLIKTYLIDNTHGAVVCVVPKKGYTAAKEAKLAEKLEEYRKSLSDAELEEIVRRTKELHDYQDEPTPQEHLKKIPMIQVSDIEQNIRPLLNEERMWKDTKVLFHEMHTAGIGYLDFVFDASVLTLEELPYLALLKSILGAVDTTNYTYQELSDEINLKTGGIMPGITNYSPLGKENEPLMIFSVRAKALYERIPETFALISEMLFETKLDNDKRLSEIIGEIRSRSQGRLLSAGHSAAVLRGMSYFSPSAYLGELTGGIAYYQFIEELDRNVEERMPQVREKLQMIMKKLFTRQAFFLSFTADEDGYGKIGESLERFTGRLSDSVYEKAVMEFDLKPQNEGFQCSSQVNYVARCGNFKTAGYSFTGAMRILQVMMNYDYLWTNIRVKGGAYGCMSGFGRDGETYFVSYRDPQVAATNQIYEGIPAYLKTITLDERDLTKYIIGSISELDVPMNPAARGNRGLAAYLSNTTEELLQAERNQVLHATVEDIQALAKPMEAVLSQNCLCVVGNEDQIESAGIFMETKQLFKSE